MRRLRPLHPLHTDFILNTWASFIFFYKNGIFIDPKNIFSEIQNFSSTVIKVLRRFFSLLKSFRKDLGDFWTFPILSINLKLTREEKKAFVKTWSKLSIYFIIKHNEVYIIKRFSYFVYFKISLWHFRGDLLSRH